ncbi:MAG: DTW domain-containing protein [Deltaproteobacteria bacterium]|nr:DTW domain-containing protein [Deltaproteobacteria bacterium]
MSRRDNADVRCPRCRMHESLCICALVPRIATRTRLVLIIHLREHRKTTNTGRLAALCLPNSQVIVRGHESAPREPFAWDSSTQPLLLYPHDDAVPIAQFAQFGPSAQSAETAQSNRPVTLVVPDGTWRQASKVRNRVPGLRDVPCVCLPPDAPTNYRLRHETRSEGLATIEAIARAFGFLEGASVRSALEQVFRAMVERTLWARGEIGAAEVSGGLPEGVVRHDPSGSMGPTEKRIPAQGSLTKWDESP